MAFAATAFVLYLRGGLTWRVVVAAIVASVGAIASRVLFRGKPDPLLMAQDPDDGAEGER